MRIHTNLPVQQIRPMLDNMPGVTFARFDIHGSRSHRVALEIVLSGSSARRSQAGGFDAATWDEWGIFLGNVFRADPRAKVAGCYDGRADFLRKTNRRFTNTFGVENQHLNHRWVQGRIIDGQYCAEGLCTAIRRFN